MAEKNLAIVLSDAYADWECALLMATARAECGVGITILTPGGAAVTSLGGLVVRPDGAIEDVSPAAFDALVLCGGKIWQSEDTPDLAGPVGGFIAAGKPVAAICDATLALARLGLLDERAHTSNFAGMLQRCVPGYRGGAHYRDQPAAVCDDLVITASGAAPVTFAAVVLDAIGLGSAALNDYLALYGGEHAAA